MRGNKVKGACLALTPASESRLEISVGLNILSKIRREQNRCAGSRQQQQEVAMLPSTINHRKRSDCYQELASETMAGGRLLGKVVILTSFSIEVPFVHPILCNYLFAPLPCLRLYEGVFDCLTKQVLLDQHRTEPVGPKLLLANKFGGNFRICLFINAGILV